MCILSVCINMCGNRIIKGIRNVALYLLAFILSVISVISVIIITPIILIILFITDLLCSDYVLIVIFLIMLIVYCLSL